MHKKRYTLLGLPILLLLLIANVIGHASETTIVKHTDTIEPQKDGFWQQKTTWKSRWVKYWRTKAIYVPVWKKVWGPVVHNEWVPLPNTPPGWQKRDVHSEVRRADY